MNALAMDAELTPQEKKRLEDLRVMDQRGVLRGKEMDEFMALLAKRKAKPAQDAQPFRFACDSIKDCKGQIIQRIGATVIIQGLAQDSGSYFAKGAAGARRFKTQQEAVDLAGYWAMDASQSFSDYKAWTKAVFAKHPNAKLTQERISNREGGMRKVATSNGRMVGKFDISGRSPGGYVEDADCEMDA
jgi:hypothetical protein